MSRINIPYRTRRLLKRIASVLLVLVVLGLVVWAGWVLWLGRYVVYTRDQGAMLDFSHANTDMQGQPALEPTEGQTIPIYYNEGDNAISTSTELTQLNGFYISLEMLEKSNPDSLISQLSQLPPETPILLDVKSIKGNFVYSSSVSTQRNGQLDIEGMDRLIKFINGRFTYTIARMPALRDFHYGLDHVSDGLPTAGGYLWIDSDSCYWLSPTSEGTRNYLTAILSELKKLGFDEVVLYDFYFPATDQIVYNQDKTAALEQTAQYLVDNCTGSNFAVSFVQKTKFAMPQGRSRMYLENIPAAEAAKAAKESGMENTPVNLVFLTDLHDTRFDSYGVLRPLSIAR